MNQYRTALLPFGIKQNFIFSIKANEMIDTIQATGWEFYSMEIFNNCSILMFVKKDLIKDV